MTEDEEKQDGEAIGFNPWLFSLTYSDSAFGKTTNVRQFFYCHFIT